MKRVIIGLFLFFIPNFVYAANYTITDQLIQAEIQENGNLKISELIVMDGTFNGYEKTLSYANSLLEDNYSSYDNNSLYNASDLRLVSIQAKYVDQVDFDTFQDSDFDLFTLDYAASNGDKGKYTSYTNENGYTYRMYYAANHERVAFLITYIVEQAIVLHEDVAELYWNFITPNDYDDINHIQVKVLLPESDYSDLFRFWAHGDLSGDVEKLEYSNGILATISHMDASSVLDIRMTFDRNLIKDISNVKTTNDSALSEIIEVEEKRAEVANDLRNQLKTKWNIAVVASWILFGAIIGLGIYIYLKYGKSPKSSYYSKYNREFIDDYNVEVIDYLMKRQITPNALSAFIMNLIYKKNISAKEIVSDKKKQKDYEFTLENTEHLVGSEELLVGFLFDTVGKGNVNEKKQKVFTTKDLKDYASGTKTCSKFIKSYTAWKNSVMEEGKKEEFFETSNKPKYIGLVVLILGILLCVFVISNGIDYVLSYIVIILSIVFFFCSIAIYKKTQKGSEHYARWMAFKNFLDDFGSFELKELPEIILWERYLVYATIFGLADKVEKSMNVYISEMNIDATSDYYPMFFYINLGPTIHSSVNNAINSAYSRQSANYANSHSNYSSGGGFGGGFSSGGGFGGGGSSGHGF